MLVGCGGSLTDEQRKQLKEGSEQQVIRKVSEAEILEEAFKKGRAIMEELENAHVSQDSVAVNYAVAVHWLEPGSSDASEIETQLIEAYLNSMMLGEELKDNVQRIGNDSLLYTKAVVQELPDGVVEVKGTWNIRMSKKQLVLDMDE